jgi:hypothetical protein
MVTQWDSGIVRQQGSQPIRQGNMNAVRWWENSEAKFGAVGQFGSEVQ